MNAFGRQVLTLSAQPKLGRATLEIRSVRVGEERDVAAGCAHEQLRDEAFEGRLGAGRIDLDFVARDLHQRVHLVFFFAVGAAAFWAWVHRATISDLLEGVKP